MHGPAHRDWPKIFAPKNLAGGFVLFLVSFSVLQNCYFNFCAGSSGRLLFQCLFDRGLFDNLNKVDELYLDLPPDKNVFLEFRGFQTENESFAEFVYFRSVYTAFPRKIYVIQPATVINRGRNFLATAAFPDEAWLDQKRIGKLIAFERQPDGAVISVKTERKAP